MSFILNRVKDKNPKPTVRTFVFVPGGAADVALRVAIEYAPQGDVKEQAERDRARIVGQQKFNRLADVKEQSEQLEDIVSAMIASRVKSVHAEDGGPVKLRHLRGLIGGLSPEAIRELGGIDAPVAFDTTDATDAPAEARVGDDGQPDPTVRTLGDVAARNVLLLVKECPRFHEWVSGIAVDPGFFQDEEWEQRLKNS